MAHAKAGDDEQAGHYLAQANDWTDKVLGDEEHPPAWNRRMTLRLLREEAERHYSASRNKSSPYPGGNGS